MSKFFPRPGWLVVVTVVALLERLALWLAYPPVIFDDSNSYRRLAGQILGAAPFDGTRSPGYPIFLAWLGPDRVVYAVQLLLGLATTLLFFYLGWLITGKTWVGAAAALLHTLNLGQLFFEADLLAESLTTFLVLVTICGGVYFLKQETFEKLSLKQLGLALLTGIAGGLAALVRPQFVFLPFLIAFALVIEAVRKIEVQNLLTTKDTTPALAGGARESTKEELFLRFSFVYFVSFVVKALKAILMNKKLWAIILAIIIPAILLNALWINYIHTQFGVWSMSSDDGYHIIQHTGKFFEYVPDDEAAIRDTFLKYRAIQIANTGKASNTIWAAIPELQKVSGLGFYKLSRKLQEISVQLIREHPFLYLGSVFEAWAWFWSAPFYWNPQAFGMIGDWIVQFQRILLWGANVIFIAGTFVLAFPRVRKMLSMTIPIWLILSVVWVNSILQAIVEASENPRYSVSTQTLVVLVVAWWICLSWRTVQGHIIQQWRHRNETR
jgi:hypothetical protein